MDARIRGASSLTGLVLLLAPGDAVAQDSKALDEAAKKAFASIRETRGKSWAGSAESAFCGLAYLAQGSTPSTGDYAEDLRACVEGCLSVDESARRRENWYYALMILFLSEVQKKEPRDEIRERIAWLLKSLQQNQEATGGWSHKKGHVYQVFGKQVPDIAYLTALVIAAMGDARSVGIELPAGMLERALQDCKSVSNGAGLNYGTNNPVQDFGCSRGAMLLIGLHFLGQKGGMYSQYAGAVRSRLAELPQAHAFPPIHYFGTGVACYLTGSFAEWKKRWLGKLLAQRERDGSIWFKSKEIEQNPQRDLERESLKTNTMGTAILALLCCLDRNHVFQPPRPPRRRK